MHSAIPHLIELQRVDHLIASVRAEIEAFPKRVREADAKLSGARAAVAAAKEGLVSSQKERKKAKDNGKLSKNPVGRFLIADSLCQRENVRNWLVFINR